MEGGMGRETSFNLKWKTALSASAFNCIFACWHEHDFCSGQQGLLYIILSFHSWSPLNPAALCGRFIRNSVSKVTWNGPAVGPCQAEKGESAVWPSIEYAFGLGLKLKFQIWWLIAGLGRTDTGWWASCGILRHPLTWGSLLVACQQMHSGKSPRGKCINIRWIYARFAGSQIHANDLGAHQIKHNLMGYTFHNDKNQLI